MGRADWVWLIATACGRVGFDRLPPDATMLVSCAVDSDGDGIVDCFDNCPAIYNPDQANKDGDRFGDVCDPCPPVADDQPLDSDGDGVADACDPNPFVRGDAIVLFEGFRHGVPADWLQEATWAADAGDVDGTAPMGGPATLAPMTAMTGDITISTALVFETALDLGVGVNDAGVVADYAGGTGGVTCQAEIESDGTSQLAMWEAGSSTNLLASAAFTFDQAIDVTATLKRVGQTYTCAVTQSGVTASASVDYTPVNQAHLAGARSWASVTRYRWLMIVQSP